MTPWHAVKKSTLSPKFMTFIQTMFIFLSNDEKMNIANYTVNWVPQHNISFIQSQKKL